MKLQYRFDLLAKRIGLAIGVWLVLLGVSKIAPAEFSQSITSAAGLIVAAIATAIVGDLSAFNESKKAAKKRDDK